MKYLLIAVMAMPFSACSGLRNCENTMCTMMFAMVSVEMSDTTDPDLTTIRTETVLQSSGTVIHSQDGPRSFPDHHFTIADDGDLKEIGYNQNRAVDLRIYKNNNLIKTVAFKIKTDCCHVSRSEGPEQVSLN